MARSSVSDINDVWTNDLDNTALTEFLEIANRVVTRVLGGEGVAAADLEDIEKLLAIHFAKTEQPEIEAAGSIRYAVPNDLSGLKETAQGRRAMLLDPTGNLAAAAKPRARVRGFGATYDA